MTRLPACDAAAPDPRLARALHGIVAAGAVLVLALPAARGYNAWLGALPLWLLAMPLASLWALHGFRLPRWQRAPAGSARPRRRRAPQARRRRQYPAASRALTASSRPISISSATRQNS